MASKDVAAVSVYDSSSIKVLEGLEAVRLRPAMYIGSTGEPGCTISCTRSSTTPLTKRWPAMRPHIEVTIHIDNSVTVVDDGRGIPVDMHETKACPRRRW